MSKVLTKGLTKRTYRDSKGKRRRFNTCHIERHDKTYVLAFTYRFFNGEDDDKRKIHVGELLNTINK